MTSTRTRAQPRETFSRLNFGPISPHFFALATKCLRRASYLSRAYGDYAPAIYLGCGDGSIVRLNGKNLKREAKGKASGAVTSLSPVRGVLNDVVSDVYFGTSESNIYYCEGVQRETLAPKLRASCHSKPINDIAFSRGLAPYL